MRNKKSLLSVLLVAVLLLSCVAGMLIFGASAEEGTEHKVWINTTTGGNASNSSGTNIFRAFRGATQWASKQTFNPGDTLTIEIQENISWSDTGLTANAIDVTDSSSANDPMIVDTNGRPVPITIKPAAGLQNPTISFTGPRLRFGNHYKFEDITFNIQSTANLYVGIYLEFYNCTINSTGNAAFFACMDSKWGYKLTDKNVGYHVNGNGELLSEIVISGNTTVSSKVSFAAYRNVNASGFPLTAGDYTFTKSDNFDGTASNVSGKIRVEDEAQIASIIVGASGREFGNAYIEVNGGTVAGVRGIASVTTDAGYTGHLNPGEKVKITIDGGTVNGDVYALVGNRNIRENSEASVEIISGTVNGSVYGMQSGSDAGSVRAGATISVSASGGTLNALYGLDGKNLQIDPAAVIKVKVSGNAHIGNSVVGAIRRIGSVGNLSVSVDGGTVGYTVYGVDSPNGDVTGSLNLSVTGGTLQGNGGRSSLIALPDNTQVAGVTSNVTIDGGTFYSTVTGTNVTIYDGIFYSTVTGNEITVTNATFHGSVEADNLEFAGGTVTLNTPEEVTINVNDVTGLTTIYRTALYKEGHTMLTLPYPEAAVLITLDNTGSRGYAWKTTKDENLVVEGKIPSGSAVQLTLTDRVITNVYLNKDALDHALVHANEDITFDAGKALGSKTLTRENLTKTAKFGEVWYYVVELPALGAADFDETITIFSSALSAIQFTINGVAEDGVELYKDKAATANLFQALVDYGKAAEDTLEELSLDIIDSSDIGTGFGATRDEAATIQFTKKTLLMGDTIGIRLTFDAATWNEDAEVFYGNKNITDLCRIDEENGTLDVFVNAKNLNTTLKIVVKDGEVVCLDLVDSVKHIASQLVDEEPGNMKAQATLQFIQAVQNYAA